MSFFIETIIVDGIEYRVENLREDDLVESVYVISKNKDLIDCVFKSIVSIKKTKEGVMEFITKNPPKRDEEDEDAFGNEWYDVELHNVS